jgi:hypothetical protein
MNFEFGNKENIWAIMWHQGFFIRMQAHYDDTTANKISKYESIHTGIINKKGKCETQKLKTRAIG